MARSRSAECVAHQVQRVQVWPGFRRPLTSPRFVRPHCPCPPQSGGGPVRKRPSSNDSTSPCAAVSPHSPAAPPMSPAKRGWASAWSTAQLPGELHLHLEWWRPLQTVPRNAYHSATSGFSQVICSVPIWSFLPRLIHLLTSQIPTFPSFKRCTIDDMLTVCHGVSVY